MTSPTPSLYAAPVLAHVVRSGFVESVHHGSVVAVDGAGTVLLAARRRHRADLPAVVQQAAAGARHGPRRPATSTASCWPSPAPATPASRSTSTASAGSSHGAGLKEDDLQNTPDLPYDEAERRAWIAEGRPASALAQNCSGKHAAMLATCVANGWDLATYRDPAHPLQQLMGETLAELAGEPVAATGIDGCGAPVMAISLTGLARAFGRLASPPRAPTRPGWPRRSAPIPSGSAAPGAT